MNSPALILPLAIDSFEGESHCLKNAAERRGTLGLVPFDASVGDFEAGSLTIPL